MAAFILYIICKRMECFLIFKLLSSYIKWTQFSPGWFRKYIFYLSLPGKIISYYGRYTPLGKAASHSSSSVAETPYRPNVPHDRYFTHASGQAPFSLGVTDFGIPMNTLQATVYNTQLLDKFPPSGFPLRGSELQDTPILPACHKHHHHCRYQTQASHLHKQPSSPSSAQNILQERTVSHPQIHIKSCHCPFSAHYAVTESRSDFRHRAISPASLTSTRTRFCLKHKKPVLK